MESEVPIVSRNMEEIGKGDWISVSAHTTTKPGFLDREGVIRAVERDGEGVPVTFDFENAEHDWQVEVTIGKTTSESSMREKESERWVSRGPPIRVSAYPGFDDWEAIQAFAYKQLCDGEDTTTVAAAEIGWNRSVFHRGDWSECHANENQTLSFR